MSQLVLSIGPASSSPGWTGKWTVDGRAAGASIEVAGAEFEGIRRLSRQFLELFERDGRPLVEPEALRAIGRELFARWLGPVWDDVRPQVGRGAHGLLIRSGDRDALNLPWELIELSDGLAVGCDAAWSLRRTPLDRLESGEGDLLPGPLRLLFLAAAPIDGVPLDYEREEDAILQATGKLRGGVVLHFAETGSFDELADLVARVRPHVVHLSGHGVVTTDGRGTFAFEDERGRGDLRDAEEIVADVFRGSTVRCVFFNGCQTAQAAAAGLCQALVAAGLPLAVGWSASVADDLATEFAQVFYKRLLAGEPLPAAAAHARRAIQKLGHRRMQEAVVQDATFALPQVYCATESADLYDRAAPPEPYTGPKTEYFLLGDGIKGLREGFIGRRREVQRLVPALREGDVTFAVITGLGGAGKSTLATRAANRLHADGFRLLPVRARRLENETAEACGQRVLSEVIAALDRAFVAEKREDLHAQLTNADLPLRQRLALAIDGMNELRLLLVIDNFEDALELETRQIADSELAEFYWCLASGLTRGSAVIVTCRYLPESTPAGQATVRAVLLPDWQEHEFLKYLRRDAQVESRMRRGEISRDLLVKLYGMFGGTPRFLEGVRAVLREIAADDLAEELERTPGEETDVEPGALEQLRDRYFREIFAERLYDALSAEAQQALSRLAVSELPLPLDGIAGLCDCDDAEAAGRLSPSLHHGLVQEFNEPGLPTLHHPPGLLRPWLAAEERLPADHARACHARLAEFWKASYEAKRAEEFRVPTEVELFACREHAEKGKTWTVFRWATVRLAGHLQQRNEWRLARVLLEEVPEKDRDASCLLTLGRIESLLGDWKLARKHLEAAALSGDRMEHAEALQELATIALNEGDYERAREEFGRVLELVRAIGNRAGESAALYGLATIALQQSDYEGAQDAFGRALEIKQLVGDRSGEAATLHQLAIIAVHTGDYGRARKEFVRILELVRAIGNRAGEAATLGNLATIALREGDFRKAREEFGRALETVRAIGDRAGESGLLHQLATVALREGDCGKAREEFGRVLEMKRAIGDRAGEVAAGHQLASIALLEGDYQKAREEFARTLETRRAIGDRAGEAATLHQLASIAFFKAEYRRAHEEFAQALDIRQAIGDRAGEAATLNQLGMITFKQGRIKAGAALVAVAWSIFRSIGERHADFALRDFYEICAHRALSARQAAELMKESISSYGADRGMSLLAKAFPEK